MKKRILKILSGLLSLCMMLTGMSVASSAVVEIIDENFIYGTEIAYREDFCIVPGVTESYVVTQNDDGSNRVDSYVLEVDMSNPEIGIITSYKDYMNSLGEASWGMQTLRDQAFEAEDYYRNTVGNDDFEVVAGVNGDFFNMGSGAPTGTLVMNGIKYNENKNWPFFAILDDGTCVIGDRGDKLPENAMQVLGGPEVLIENGEFTDAVNTSGYGVEAHPRTAIGIKADGSIIMLVSDGRQAPASCGQTFHMLAEEMLALGCVDALCLDGGGSASFASQRENEDYLELRNIPSDGIERTVSTSLLIYTNTDTNVKTNTNLWAEEDGKVVYYSADGVRVTGSQTIDGFSYVFDDEGALTSFAVINVDGTLKRNVWTDQMYYLGEDGLPVKGEKKIDGITFIFDETSGKLKSADAKNKWFEFASSVCYFNKNGNLVTGEKKIGGYNYKFDKEGRLTVYACVRDDGTLVKNQWIGKLYYLGENGLPVTGKVKIDKYTYTFGDDGKFIKGQLAKEGNFTYYYIAGQRQRNWHLIDGYWHYFDRQTGYGMATAGNCDKVSMDIDRKDGLYTVLTTDAMLLFKFDNNGRLIRGAWLETDYGKAYYWGNHQRMTGWQVIDSNLYYFNENAYTVSGNQTIDGAEYTFRASGKLDAKSEIIYTSDKAYAFNDSKKVEHVYNVVETKVDCTHDAVRTLTCTDCDDVKTEVLAEATGHNYTSVVTPPTIDEQGFTTYTCSFCGDTYISDYVGAIGHEYEAVVTAPTCTEKGYTTYSCKNCEESYVTDYVDATGHNYESAVTAPTCTEKGFTTNTCAVCNDTYTSDYVDASGHDYVSVVTEPTCASKGYTTYTCHCGDSYVADYVDAKDHNYVAVVTPPTCTEKGYTTYMCECGFMYVGTYVDPAHSYGEWEIVSPAGYEQEGLEKRVCKGCGYTEERVIPALEAPSDAEPHLMPGDINNDGRITAMDARLALRIAAKIDKASDEQLVAADFNNDSKITAMDARLILRKSARVD